MKGIILAGGSGTRLYPVTKAISKQLLPVHDKPMIYYPLSVLMMARIKEVLIISSPRDIPTFKELLGDGSNIGISIEYAVQDNPNGIAEAFLIGEEFINNEPVSLILGDNIFYGYDFSKFLLNKKMLTVELLFLVMKCLIQIVLGWLNLIRAKKVISLEEKPKHPKSNYAVVGFYIYDKKVVEYAKKLKPSARGELEITDLNRIYLKNGNLNVATLGKGFAWLDTGTAKSLLEASQFVNIVEKKTRNKSWMYRGGSL